MSVKEISGQRFSRLTVISRAENSPLQLAQWFCRCDCGKEIVTRGSSLRTGHAKSCGCLNKEIVANTHFTHRMTRTPTHGAWLNMLARCRNAKGPAFRHYGGRGISVCERWKSFENFLADMGEKPLGKSLDRINNDGNYESSNCRWATHQQQMNNIRVNRLIEYGGIKMTVTQWGRKIGIKPEVLRGRLKLGWSVEKIIETPLQQSGYRRRKSLPLSGKRV